MPSVTVINALPGATEVIATLSPTIATVATPTAFEVAEVPTKPKVGTSLSVASSVTAIMLDH